MKGKQIAGKGKQIAGKVYSAKRKREDSDRSQRNRSVLQFFDDAAEVDNDEAETSEEEEDDIDLDQDFSDELEGKLKGKEGFGKSYNLPFLPKEEEEELSDDELERLLEERYRSGSKHVVYAEDEYENKVSVDKSLKPCTDGPVIWRVKCRVGRERQAAFCLIQKYVDLQSLGTKLKIVSAFAVDHVCGSIYFEADREFDVIEACKGISTIYASRISRVPSNEVVHLFSVKNTSSKASAGMWVRVKAGNYKGDLAQVVAVDNTRKRATIKLIPRIDLKALAKKLAGGGTVKQTVVPAPRVISPSDLEEFRSRIQVKRDRQSGESYETIDGLTLKDGFLYKKLSVESLSYLDIIPSRDELLKFKNSKKDAKRDASDDVEWLSDLYAKQRKTRSSECSKGTTKGSEGTSGTKKADGLKVHDLVFFGPKDFGVIIGLEDDSFQVLKADVVEGAEVVTVELHEISSSSLERKFTTLDKHNKTISIKDNVRVMEGPFEGKQGTIKHICKGTVFIYDENQIENGGYFCAKSEWCENSSHSNDACHEDAGDGLGQTGFEDSTSPSFPEFSRKPWETKENTRDFNSRRQGDRDAAFSIGQSLRIRVGPLKGYLCRVIAIYRSDVTVKLDSQMKIITVKCEDLSEVGVKSTRGTEFNISRPFGGFGAELHSGEVSGAAGETNEWNSGLLSAERKPWPEFSSSDFLLDSSLSNPFGSLNANDDTNKDSGNDPWGGKGSSKNTTDSWGKVTSSSGDQMTSWSKAASEKQIVEDKDSGGDPWGSKESSKKATDSWAKAITSGGDQTSSWSKAASEEKVVDDKEGKVDNWGSANGWDRGTSNTSNGTRGTSAWGTTNHPTTGGSQDAGGSWAAAKSKIEDSSNDPTTAWGKTQNTNNSGSWDAGKNWDSQASKKNDSLAWDKGKGVSGNEEGDCGNKVDTQVLENSWAKAAESWKTEDGSGRGKSDCWNSAPAAKGNQTGGWGNLTGNSTQTEAAHKAETKDWNKSGSGAAGASSWSKGTASPTEGAWNNPRGYDNKAGCDGGVDQQDSWNSEISFDMGRGSGGRGRGGFRGANGDPAVRGSFGRGRSSSCNKEDQFNSVETASGKASGWNSSAGWKSGANDAGENPSSGWNSNSSNWKNVKGNQSSGWKQELAADDDYDKSERKDCWNSKNDFVDDKGSGWKTGPSDVGGNKLSGWGKNNSWGTTKNSSGNQSSVWNQGISANDEAGGVKNQGDGWKASDSNLANNWNQKASVEGGDKEQSNNWNKGSVGNTNSSGGWNNEAGDGASWKKSANAGDGDKGQSNNWKKGSFGNRDNLGGWNKGAGAGEGASWKKSANAGDGDKGQSNNWNKGDFGDRDVAGDWRGGKSFGRGRTSWTGGPSDESSGDQTDFCRGNRGGRFGDRGGGFGNRGRGRRDQCDGGWKGGSGNDDDNDWTNENRGGGFGSRGRGRWNQSEGGGGNDDGNDWRSGNRGGGFGSRGRGRWNQSEGGGGNNDGNDWKSGNRGVRFGSRGRGRWNQSEGGGGNDDGNDWRSGNRGGGFGNRGCGRFNRSEGGGGNDDGNDWRSGNRGGTFGNRGRGRRDLSGGSWNGGGSGEGNDWRSGNGSEDGSRGQAVSWNNKSGSAVETGGSGWNNGYGSAKEADGTTNQSWGGWNKSTGATNGTGGTSWNNEAGSAKEAGGTSSTQGWGGWNESSGRPNNSLAGKQGDICDNSLTPDKGQWSGWAKEGNSVKVGENSGGACWGKEAGSLKGASSMEAHLVGGWAKEDNSVRAGGNGDGVSWSKETGTLKGGSSTEAQVIGGWGSGNRETSTSEGWAGGNATSDANKETHVSAEHAVSGWGTKVAPSSKGSWGKETGSLKEASGSGAQIGGWGSIKGDICDNSPTPDKGQWSGWVKEDNSVKVGGNSGGACWGEETGSLEGASSTEAQLVGGWAKEDNSVKAGGNRDGVSWGKETGTLKGGCSTKAQVVGLGSGNRETSASEGWAGGNVTSDANDETQGSVEHAVGGWGTKVAPNSKGSWGKETGSLKEASGSGAQIGGWGSRNIGTTASEGWVRGNTASDSKKETHGSAEQAVGGWGSKAAASSEASWGKETIPLKEASATGAQVGGWGSKNRGTAAIEGWAGGDASSDGKEETHGSEEQAVGGWGSKAAASSKGIGGW